MKWKTGSPIDVNFIRQMLCVCVEAETVQAKDLFYLILIGNSSREAGQKRSQLEVRQSGSQPYSSMQMSRVAEIDNDNSERSLAERQNTLAHFKVEATSQRTKKQKKRSSWWQFVTP